jgi:hypothetical protein
MVDEPPRRSYSRALLVRWLSGRKQRFAKAPYPKRVPRVRIPPSPPAITSHDLYAALLALRVRARRFERSSTGGARYAPGFESRLCGITPQSQSEALDNPSLTASPQSYKIPTRRFGSMRVRAREIRTQFRRVGAGALRAKRSFGSSILLYAHVSD